MAKGRVINKSISTSEKVNLRLRNPLDILLYVLGLTHADDEGRIDGNPTIFRGKVAPILPGLTDTRTDLALTTMEKSRLIDRYTVKGVMVVQFLDWDIHQLFHGYKRKASHFPIENRSDEITQPGDNHPLPPLKESKVKESKVIKDKYLKFVFLSERENEKLITDYGKTQAADLIDRLNIWIGQVGEASFNKKYSSHYFTILNIARRDNIKKITPVIAKPKDTPPTPAPLSPEEEKERTRKMNEALKEAGIHIGHKKEVAEAIKEAK